MKKTRSKYTQRTDGEGFQIPNGEIYKLACCDCGLVHKIVIIAPGVKNGVGIGIAVARDNRATGQRRRHRKPTDPIRMPDGFIWEMVECGNCNGHGTHYQVTSSNKHSDVKCDKCKGTGTVAMRTRRGKEPVPK